MELENPVQESTKKEDKNKEKEKEKRKAREDRAKKSVRQQLDVGTGQGEHILRGFPVGTLVWESIRVRVCEG